MKTCTDAGWSKFAKGVDDDATLESPPAGVHDGQGRGVLVDQQEGNAVGDEHRDGELVAKVDDDVAGAVRCRLVGGHDVAPVDWFTMTSRHGSTLMASATRRRFSFTCSGSSSTWSPRFSDSYGAALTPPKRSVTNALTPKMAGELDGVDAERPASARLQR